MPTLFEIFDKSFKRQGEKSAILFLRDGRLETQLSYNELKRESEIFSTYLNAKGIGKGDRVILFLEKSLYFVIFHLALQRLGTIAVPLNPGFKTQEMRYFIEDSDPSLIIADIRKEQMIKEISGKRETLFVDSLAPYGYMDRFKESEDLSLNSFISEDDPSLIIYTSGTTGQPKGAILTHKNLIHDLKKVIDVWEITEEDTLCHALPLFHVHGLCFALHTLLAAGGRIVMLDRFDVDITLKVLASKEPLYRCTIFMAVPAMYQRLLKGMKGKDYDFSHLRLITSGSAPLLPKDFFAIKEAFGMEVVEREGMTETGMNFSNPLYGKKKPGSIGKALPGLEVRIVDPDTLEDVKEGKIGEFWLKGPGISPGYWKKEQETRKAFHNGWFRTGDLGRVDPEGYYFLTDRLKHIIISGGENISPKEIENVINQIDGVKECSVVGIPDERWGEKVVTAVVKEGDMEIDEDTIKRYCKHHLHDWKCPKEIKFVKELPRNTMGKVLNDKVKSLFL